MLTKECLSHGRLMDPPARNAMWRFGYPNPVNYNDNELFCGGYAVQWDKNEGKCGLCGDPYHVEKPRPHEAGGEFARGVIARRYVMGQKIEIEVELTANHWGTFVLKLCPTNHHKIEATQECLDGYPLYVAGTKKHFVIPRDSNKKDVFKYHVSLPKDLTCTHCVLQWTYHTGNMWGQCANGTEAVGCGKAETFRNCADVSIVSNAGGGRPPTSLLYNRLAQFLNQQAPYLLYYQDVREPENVYPVVVRDQVCLAKGLFKKSPYMDQWCQTNCLSYPPNCPQVICHCPQTCDAIGDLKDREGADVYCQDLCIKYPSKCPEHRCSCY
ncbi:uncharacterized protein LOC113388983 [Ctenocephalides felis]|uniref:uncharacterized protein LOC113388983 n=1 Tax=Ctenocephalides felis TaxID=7515 RepID=UPI000E6E1812|nr:uncharacterized protein LOC113388983 [Ctenocephalides felis]